MDIKVDLGIWSNLFIVPSAVVDEHLRLASGNAIKILLYILRHSKNLINSKELADLLKISEDDALDAITYWNDCGILKYNDQLLVPNNEQTESKIEKQEMAQNKVNMPQNIPNLIKTKEKNVKIISSTAPRLSPTEVAKLTQSDPQIKFLLHQAEQLLGKFLTPTDISVLTSLYNWLGLSVDVLLMLIEYSISTGKSSMRNIEKQAISWVDMGIDTHDKADLYIRTQKQKKENYSIVKSAFGLNERDLSDNEKSYIDIWFGEWHFNIAMVKLAFNRCVDNISKVRFSYINKILKDWNEKNIRTPEQALNENSKPKNKKTNSPSYDLDEIEQYAIYNTPKL